MNCASIRYRREGSLKSLQQIGPGRAHRNKDHASKRLLLEKLVLPSACEQLPSLFRRIQHLFPLPRDPPGPPAPFGITWKPGVDATRMLACSSPTRPSPHLLATRTVIRLSGDASSADGKGAPSAERLASLPITLLTLSSGGSMVQNATTSLDQPLPLPTYLSSKKTSKERKMSVKGIKPRNAGCCYSIWQVY